MIISKYAFRRLGLPLLLPLALLAAAPFHAEDLPARPRVLFVDSYHQGFAWSEAQFEGAKAALQAAFGPSGLDLETFHLQDRLFPQARAATRAYFLELYRDRPPDLILSSDNAAYDFLAGNDWRLARSIPLVFSGVNDFHDEGLAASRLMTGIAENFLSGRADTIDAALRLLPGTERILFLLDSTPTSEAIRREILAIKERFPGVAFDFAVEEELGAQLTLVAGLRRGSILIPIGTHRDGRGDLLGYEASMEALSRACPVPSFGFIENRIGHGIVGGKILTGRDHGEKAGELAAALLRGTPVADLPPILDNPGRFIFDWTELERFGLDEKLLPPGATVINRPDASHGVLRSILLALAGATLFFALVSVFLALTRRKIQEARDRAAESEAILASYFESSPEAIFVADDEGRYIRVNQGACAVTGYSREELLGLSIRDLLAPESLEEAGSHFASVVTAGRADGVHRFLRPDGSPYSMRVNAARIAPNHNLAICSDITQRLSDELRLRESLAEKETLLKELYHRTKNNMYLLNSLLELGAPGMRDEEDRRIVAEMSGRIMAMAKVHEMLYRSDDGERTRFDLYLREMAELMSANSASRGIAFDFDLEPLTLDLARALPLGLVFHELVVNSLRHAFNGRGGTVSVALAAEGPGFRFTVADDGFGLPAGLDPSTSESMGLLVVRSLVLRQLGGELSWGGPPGTSCSILVPLGAGSSGK